MDWVINLPGSLCSLVQWKTTGIRAAVIILRRLYVILISCVRISQYEKHFNISANKLPRGVAAPGVALGLPPADVIRPSISLVVGVLNGFAKYKRP